MTDINFGQSGLSFFTGIVVNVKDPHESGRVQIRVFGRHDDTTNIPDDSLPWALVQQPVTSAAQGRIGSAPTGLIKGSRITGIWLDSDHQLPLVLGSVGKSGDIVPGATENGAPKIDTSMGSIPSSAQASTPHPYNPYSALFPGRVSIADIDAGMQNIFSVKNDFGSVITKDIEKLLTIPKVPTIGSVSPGGSMTAFQLINKVDPYSQISALPCSPTLLLKLLDISSLITGALKKVIQLAVQAAITAFLKLAQEIGLFKLLQMLNEAAQDLAAVKALMDALMQNLCGIKWLGDIAETISEADQVLAGAIVGLNTITGYIHGVTMAIPQAIADAAFSLIPPPTPIAVATTTSAVPTNIVMSPPGNYVPQYHTIDQDPYLGYIGYYNPLNPSGGTVYTLRGSQPNYPSTQAHITDVASISFTQSLAVPMASGQLASTQLYQSAAQAVAVAGQVAAAVSIGMSIMEDPVGAVEAIAAAVIADVINAINTVIKIYNSLQALIVSTTASPLAILKKIAKTAKQIASMKHTGEQTTLAIKRQMFKASLGPSFV